MKEIKNMASRLELFFDQWLIEKMEKLNFKLHNPQPEEVVIEFNKDWEGSTCYYLTVFKDGEIFRMYYRGSDFDIKTESSTHELTCYAESVDGINWTKPELNLYQFNGSKKNNIIWQGVGTHNFTPFIDTNPSVKPEERYKAVGSGMLKNKPVLFAFVSKDGINWKQWKEEPIITKGAFDSQNLAFYDNLRKKYFEYHRGWTEGLYKGIRAIMVCTSSDFENWREPEFLSYVDSPEEHLYNNGVMPYYRAPHIFIGFPMRFVPERKGVSNLVFMVSRDGKDRGNGYGGQTNRAIHSRVLWRFYRRRS